MRYYRWIVRVLLVFVAVMAIAGSVQIGSPAFATTLTEDQWNYLDSLSRKAYQAGNQGDFTQAEQYWTEIIEQMPDNAAALSNRGNVRVSQNKLQGALADQNKAVELAPNVTDPYLNRGTVYEALGEWEKAIADYNRVLELDPQDAMAYNNRGNAEAGRGNWESAIADYKKATELAPKFAFARANYALALYETGEKKEALRTLRNIIRKYPQFPDVRAAMTAILWEEGKRGEAESNWVAVVGLDLRYKDLQWVKSIRRWPPSLVAALEKFLTLN